MSLPQKLKIFRQLLRLSQASKVYLDRKERLLFLGFMILNAIGAGFEIGLLSLISPFIAVLVNPLKLEQVTQSEAPSQLRLATLLVGVFILKNAYFIGLTFILRKYFAKMRVKIARRLYGAYLNAPYLHLARKNSAVLIRNLTHVEDFMEFGISPLVTLIADGAVILAVLVYLFLQQPVITVSVIALLGTSVLLFSNFVLDRSTRYGKIYFSSVAACNKTILQGLGSDKELRLLGRQGFFIDLFAAQKEVFASNMEKGRFVREISRYFLETVLVLLVLVLIVAASSLNQNPVDTLTLLTLFMAAALRLIPSINRFLGSSISIANHMGKIEELAQELDELERKSKSDAGHSDQAELRTFQEAIKASNVSFRYPGATTNVLGGVSFTIPQGEIVALWGASGAGKSTLVELMAGLLEPSQGSLTVDGVDLRQIQTQWQRKIGYVPQQVYLLDDTVKRNVAFALPDHLIDEEAVKRALSSAQLLDFAEGLPKGLGTPLGERGSSLSGGQRQRIGIARALYNDPQILILDEATTGLDQDVENEIARTISCLKGQKTILIVTHRPDLLNICSGVISLKDGTATQRKITPSQALDLT